MKFLIWKYYLIIIIILNSCNKNNTNTAIELRTKEIEQKQIENDCENGKSKAIVDFNKGKYRLLFYGEISHDDFEFQKFFEHYVDEKYNIEIEDGGCIVTPENECYSFKMEGLIFNKFGKNIFLKAKKDARKEYEKYLKNKIKETKAEFIGGNEKLKSYIHNKIKNSGNYKGRILVKFTVKKDGSVSDIKIRIPKNNDKTLQLENEIMEIFKDMPKWKPATYNNYKTKSSFVVPIIIN